MADKIKVFCLGGLDEVYKNMTVVEINDDIFVIEAGVKFPDQTKPGIDYIIPNFDYLIANKNKVRGYFLTNGHDSVIGAIPYIYERVPAPVYCSDITKIFFVSFCKHNDINPNKFEINLVDPNQDIMINGRKISFFSTCSMFPHSMGIAIDTDQGNIIYISNNIIDTANNEGFSINLRRLSQVAGRQPLLLMLDSVYAEKIGYTNPYNKILHFLGRTIEDAPGRVFVALDAPDIYNIVEVINHAVKCGKLIAAYDQTTRELLANLIVSKQLKLNKENIASMDDVHRLRPQSLLVLIIGFGKSLCSKISLLATRHNDDKYIFLNETDTFIVGIHKTFDNEIALTNSINDLYHNDCRIITMPDKQYLRAHSSIEDIKSTLAMIRPKNYLPVTGNFKALLANAKIAIDMNIGLTHSNVFVLDNGTVLTFDNGVGKMSDEKIITGDLFIDGKGIGDVVSNVLQDRQRFSDDGVVILAATISKSARKIVAGPDVQTRGLLFVKENDALLREISKLFIMNIENEILKANYSIAMIENSTKDSVLRSIRRHMLKTPVIIPIIAEID